METFRTLVNAVIENNVLNNAKWSDWTDSKHVQEVYGQLEEDERKEMYEAMINELIDNTGINLEAYFKLIRAMDYGV